MCRTASTTELVKHATGVLTEMKDEQTSTNPASDLTDYKRKIAEMDKVILCVAEAEKLVREIGRSLLEGANALENNSRKTDGQRAQGAAKE